MKKILSTFCTLFMLATLWASAPAEVPRLVVAITIDQLRTDYLEMFRHNFGSGGFNRLLNEGLVYTNIEFDFPHLDRASTITTIFTGANPSYHGIVGEYRWSINDNRPVSSFFDNNYTGIFSTDRFSPRPIRVSTIANELKIASGGQSDVFAFAPHASQALASGGHSANASFWLDAENAKWATSTFFQYRSLVVDQHNRSVNHSLTYRMGGINWRPATDPARFNAFPYTRSVANFHHAFTMNPSVALRLFKQSPYVNTEVVDIALKVLQTNALGTRRNPDFLALTFYAGTFDNAIDRNFSIEIQDTYYRLDREIERVLNAVDEAVGLENALIFVVSTGYFNEQEVIPDGVIPSGGDFNSERNLALLNMYLMNAFGEGQWIRAFYNQQIFFDRVLLERNNIDIAEFQARTARLLVELSGVQDVITSQQMMLHGAYNQMVSHHRNGFVPGVSGDLFLVLTPGWRIIDPQNPNLQHRVRSNAVLAPAIFFGNGIQPQRVTRTIQATEIAPSVSHRLRIRAPNAARGRILEELL